MQLNFFYKNNQIGWGYFLDLTYYKVKTQYNIVRKTRETIQNYIKG